MTQKENQPEKKIISKGWKAFIIISLLVYIAAAAYVGYFLDGKVNPDALSRMAIFFASGSTIFVVTFKKNNMKW